MAKRTFAFVAVFAALLSVTLSVQADNYNYYWSGASDSNYLTTANWNVGAPDGPQATVDLTTAGNNITAYMYKTYGVVTLNNDTLGTAVSNLNIGKVDGTSNATLSKNDVALVIDHNKTLTLLNNGKLSINIDTTNNYNYQIRNNGTLNISGGTLEIVKANSFRIGNDNDATLNISGGELIVNSPTYLGVNGSSKGTVVQSGGTVTLNAILDFGWGPNSPSGEYTLSGGVLNTNSTAGLSCYSSEANTFTVNGGTANFNYVGAGNNHVNSFAVGFNGSNTNNPGNTFTLSSGTVNVADTFLVAKKGTLNINGGEFNAPTITVDSTSTLKMTGGALKTNAINMNGGTFTQGGGSLVYNGKLTVTGNAVLNGTIDMSKFLAKPNQTVTVVTTTNAISGNYTISDAGWSGSIVDNNKINATYAGDTNITYYDVESGVYDLGSNWKEFVNGEWRNVSTTYVFGNSNTDSNNRDCYILPFYDATNSTVKNVSVTFNNTYLKVNSITVGNGIGDDTGTVTVTRGGALDVQTNLTINKGGAFSVSDALSVTAFNGTSGTLTVDGGTFSTNTTSVSGNLNVLDGTFTSTGAATINAGGKVSISGGDFNANSSTTVSGNLTINDGNFNAKGATTVNSSGDLTVNGGTFEFNNSDAQFLVKGDINVLSGNFTITSSNAFRIGDYAKGTVNIEGGTVTVKAPTYMGIGANSGYVGTINQKTGSTVTFENVLALGWGDYVTGVYNLSGGTLTTTDSTGLWCANPNGASTFNVTGGTANFNKAGNSFEIGLYQTYDPNQVANVFNLNSGTVNAADTFAIQYGGTLKVAKTDNNTLGDGVLNANKIDINNGGNLNMSSGTIKLGSGGITNTSGAYTITLSGGTFGTNGASWETSLNATISSNAVTFAPDAGKSITWRGVMSGAGALTKTGAGTLELFGANAYTGGTTISAGTLKLSGDGTLGTGNVTNNSILEFAHSSNKTFSNVISGSGSVTKTGTETLDIQGANTYSGGTTITNGTIRLLSNGSLGSGSISIDTNGFLTFGGDMTPQPKTIANAVSGTGTIVKQGASDFTANLDGNLTGFSGNMIISGGTLSVLMNGTNRSLNVTNLSGPGNLELRLASGNGNTTLPNLTNNGFTGVISLVESGGSNGNKIDTGTKSFEGFTFNINSGTTIYVDEAAFGANVNLSGTGNNEGHGALRLHNNMTGNITVMANNSVLGIDRTAVTVSGNIASGANSGETTLVIKSVVNDNGKGTFTGVISDGNAGSKLGVQVSGGRHTFSGANTYTGGTTISAGTLVLSGDGTLGTGTVANNATLEFAHTADLTGANAFANVISGIGAVNKTGSGKLTLTGANTYSGGTTISAGTLVLSGDGTLGTGTVANNATLEFAHTADLTGANAFSNVISGTGAVNKTGTGTLTLSGANTYTGMTTVSAGVLELTGDAVVANGPVTVEANGTLVYNVDGEQTKLLSISEINKIVSTGQVIKTGDGTLKLCALYAEADKMIDVQSLTVSSGRVDIKEYFYGKLIVDSEGTFSPGNSVGSLTIGDGTYGGGFILNEAGAELLMEIGGSAASANDVLIVEGDITLVDGSVITLVNNSNLGLGESFTAILSAENSANLDVLGHIQTTDFTDLKYVEINDATHGTVYAITGRTLNANEIPEPSTWALLILGAAGLLYWRKKKNA